MNTLIFTLVIFLCCASLEAKPSADNLLDEITRELKVLAHGGDVMKQRTPSQGLGSSKRSEEPKGPKPNEVSGPGTNGEQGPKPNEASEPPTNGGQGPKPNGASGPRTNGGPNSGEESEFLEGLNGSNGGESPENFDEPAGERIAMGEMGDKIVNMLGKLSAHFSENAKKVRENAKHLTPEVRKMAVNEERFEKASAQFRELQEELQEVLQRISKAVSEFDSNPLEGEETDVPEEPPQESMSPQQKRFSTRNLEKLLRSMSMK